MILSCMLILGLNGSCLNSSKQLITRLVVYLKLKPVKRLCTLKCKIFQFLFMYSSWQCSHVQYLLWICGSACWVDALFQLNYWSTLSYKDYHLLFAAFLCFYLLHGKYITNSTACYAVIYCELITSSVLLLVRVVYISEWGNLVTLID